MKNKKVWKAGIYTRVSETELNKAESDSIANQKDYLRLFIDKDHTLCEERVYCDDGISGGSYNRAAFNSMINDIEKGVIDCVIVKDLSRLGREKNKTDELVEVYFPSNQIRFISVSERIDSYLRPERMDSIDIPFTNLINENYIKQTSISTKSSLRIKQKEGKYVGSKAPFGYIKSPDDKHKLIVCKENGHTVKKIFSMYSSGKTLKEITRELNENCLYNNRKWDSSRVRNILSNPIYTGDMVQNRTYSPNHKVKKRIPLPKHKWIAVPDTHEALVDKSTFKLVSNLLSRDVKPVRAKSNDNAVPSVLAGYIYCKDCGQKMIRKSKLQNGERVYSFICSTYKKCGKSACNSHHINESIVCNILLKTINLHAQTFIDEKEFIEKLEKQNKDNNVSSFIKSKKSKLQSQLKELKEIREGLYMDYKRDIITPIEYSDLKASFESQYNELTSELVTIDQQIEKERSVDMTLNEAQQYFKQNRMFKELNRNMVVHLVDKIIISDSKEIALAFRYRDPFKDAINNH